MAITHYTFAIFAAVSLFGCQKKPSDSTIPSNSASLNSVKSCGSSPRGELVAERIYTAEGSAEKTGLYEGPVWIRDALYFSNFTFAPGFPSRIQRLDLTHNVVTVIEDSGTNGLAVDEQGLLVAATHKYKNLSRYDLANNKRTTLVADYDGNVFNSPNDLVVARDSTIYFTDPDFQRDAAPGGQGKTRVYRLGADGKISVVDDTLANPNGITLSPAGDWLYVNGNGEQGVIRAYPITNGVPQAGQDLVTGLTYADGMTVDCQGNLYVTEHTLRRVQVFDPRGQRLASIAVDANVTNVAFGGKEGQTLYITGAGAIWKVELDITGSVY